MRDLQFVTTTYTFSLTQDLTRTVSATPNTLE